jgi:cytochrome c553
MTRTSLIAAILAAGCGRPALGDKDPPQQPPEPVRFDRPALVQFHMRRQLDDLRKVERLLIAGQLDEAKARAAPLAQPAPDPGMARWQHDVDAVSEAARALVTAPSIDEAWRRGAQVAEACAWCHLRTQTLPVFAVPAALPPDDPTPAARMKRHQWAADRLWEGMVGPSDPRWRSGLEVLAKTPLPFTPFTDAPLAASQLQVFAQQAIASLPSDTLEDRTRRYSAMLVMCSACHGALHVGSAAAAR